MSVQHKYVFNVRLDANKLEIKAAVEQAFDVDVVAVNTINMRGKVRRWGRKLGRTSAWKKAIVTLEEGQTIDVFEGLIAAGRVREQQPSAREELCLYDSISQRPREGGG